MEETDEDMFVDTLEDCTLETATEVLQEEVLESEVELMLDDWVEAPIVVFEVAPVLVEEASVVVEEGQVVVEEALVVVEEALLVVEEAPVLVEEDSDEDFEYPGRVFKPKAPPAPGTFPTFSRGPLSVMERNPSDLTWYLRRALQLFHPKEFGSFGQNQNQWWSVRMSTKLLTSSISRSLVAGTETFALSDFLPWSAM